MALLTATTVSRAGVDVAGAAADVAGDRWVNTGKEYVVIKNGGGGAITVTLDVKATVDDAVVTDPTVSIGAGVTKIIGPFPTGIYNDDEDEMNITYSGVTTVTVKVLKLPAST